MAKMNGHELNQRLHDVLAACGRKPRAGLIATVVSLREAVFAAFSYGCTVPEIATGFGRTVPHVRVLLAQARRQLRGGATLAAEKAAKAPKPKVRKEPPIPDNGLTPEQEDYLIEQLAALIPAGAGTRR